MKLVTWIDTNVCHLKQHTLPITNIFHQVPANPGWIYNNSWQKPVPVQPMIAHTNYTQLLQEQFFYFDFGYSSTLSFVLFANDWPDTITWFRANYCPHQNLLFLLPPKNVQRKQ